MLTIQQAEAHDLEVILELRDEASAWLADIGSEQWQHAWPDDDTQANRIAKSIAAGETWMVRDHLKAAGTVAVDRYADPQLWNEHERTEPALYFHRLIVARAYAGVGLGAQIVNWVATSAAAEGIRWLRADVWTTNERLQGYYRRHHFTHVRTLNLKSYPSGAL